MDRTAQINQQQERLDCIQYEGRDENGEKLYSVFYGGADVGTFQTYDEAMIALHAHIAALAK